MKFMNQLVMVLVVFVIMLVYMTDLAFANTPPPTTIAPPPGFCDRIDLSRVNCNSNADCFDCARKHNHLISFIFKLFTFLYII